MRNLMNMEILKGRLKEIEIAITNTSAQLNALQGHKTEVTYWIQQLQESSPEANETVVDIPVEPVVE